MATMTVTVDADDLRSTLFAMRFHLLERMKQVTERKQRAETYKNNPLYHDLVNANSLEMRNIRDLARRYQNMLAIASQAQPKMTWPDVPWDLDDNTPHCGRCWGQNRGLPHGPMCPNR